MPARFHAPVRLVSGTHIDLSEEEAQHATRVLRLGIGAAVRAFDGAGHEFQATVLEAGKKGVRLSIGAESRPAAEARVAITLVQAVLKGDKMDDVVRDAVMLGVTAIQPVVTERSETSVAALERGARRERWQRVAIASTKQCGRAVVPVIAAPVLWSAMSVAHDGMITVMCVEPGAASGGQSIRSLPAVAPHAARLLVGPEGGWTPAEVARGAGTALLVTLGDRTLRADQMALIALTALYTWWGEL